MPLSTVLFISNLVQQRKFLIAVAKEKLGDCEAIMAT